MTVCTGVTGCAGVTCDSMYRCDSVTGCTGVTCDSAYRCDSITGVGKWLHMLPCHSTLGEPQDFR